MNKTYLLILLVVQLATTAAWAAKDQSFLYARQSELISEKRYKMGPIRWCQILLAGLHGEVKEVLENRYSSAPGAFPQEVDRAYGKLSSYGAPVEHTLDLVLSSPLVNSENLESVAQILLHSRVVEALPEKVQQLIDHTDLLNSMTLNWIALALIRPELPLENVHSVYEKLFAMPLASQRDRDGLSFLSESSYAIAKLFLYKPGAQKIGISLLRELINHPSVQFYWLRYISGNLQQMVVLRYLGFGRASLKGLGIEELLQDFDKQLPRLYASLKADKQRALKDLFSEISQHIISVRRILPH